MAISLSGGVKPKVNVLGQPISGAKALSVDAGKQIQAIGGAAPAPAAKASPPAYSSPGKALDINAGLQRQAVLGGGVSADSPDSPRSKAAKLMKRQAGIGQLKTMHVEEPDL